MLLCGKIRSSLLHHKSRLPHRKAEFAKSLSWVNKAEGTAQLWKAVNKLTGKQCAPGVDLSISVEMNRFYAAASTDDDYLPPVLKATVTRIVATCLELHISILDTLKPTAEGMDRLPA